VLPGGEGGREEEMMERWKNGKMGRIGILACQGLSESQIKRIERIARITSLSFRTGGQPYPESRNHREDRHSCLSRVI